MPLKRHVRLNVNKLLPDIDLNYPTKVFGHKMKTKSCYNCLYYCHCFVLLKVDALHQEPLFARQCLTTPHSAFHLLLNTNHTPAAPGIDGHLLLVYRLECCSSKIVYISFIVSGVVYITRAGPMIAISWPGAQPCCLPSPSCQGGVCLDRARCKTWQSRVGYTLQWMMSGLMSAWFNLSYHFTSWRIYSRV